LKIGEGGTQRNADAADLNARKGGSIGNLSIQIPRRTNKPPQGKARWGVWVSLKRMGLVLEKKRGGRAVGSSRKRGTITLAERRKLGKLQKRVYARGGEEVG